MRPSGSDTPRPRAGPKRSYERFAMLQGRQSRNDRVAFVQRPGKRSSRGIDVDSRTPGRPRLRHARRALTYGKRERIRTNLQRDHDRHTDLPLRGGDFELETSRRVSRRRGKSAPRASFPIHDDRLLGTYTLEETDQGFATDWSSCRRPVPDSSPSGGGTTFRALRRGAEATWVGPSRELPLGLPGSPTANWARGGASTGTVVGPDGAPVAGATVSVYRSEVFVFGVPDTWVGIKMTTTNADGDVSLRSVADPAGTADPLRAAERFGPCTGVVRPQPLCDRKRHQSSSRSARPQRWTRNSCPHPEVSPLRPRGTTPSSAMSEGARCASSGP